MDAIDLRWAEGVEGWTIIYMHHRVCAGVHPGPFICLGAHLLAKASQPPASGDSSRQTRHISKLAAPSN